jgi:dihydropteroate synthase
MRPLFSLSLPGGRTIELGVRTIVVGVVNVTPDSFSDGALYLDPARAAEHAFEFESQGADIIEVGGESTRPGAAPVPAKEEMQRVMPVIESIAGRLQAPVAIDTYKSEVASVAVDLGAAIINDVSALRFDPAIADVAAQSGAALILMHMRGDPTTMQQLEPSRDILSEIGSDLKLAAERAMARGVGRDQIVLDPGIGFGKTLEDNLAIINQLGRFSALGFPLMIGTSRKSFIGRLTGKPPAERLFGTAASVALAIAKGAHLIRVHDVAEMAEVARVTDAIIEATSPG